MLFAPPNITIVWFDGSYALEASVRGAGTPGSPSWAPGSPHANADADTTAATALSFSSRLMETERRKPTPSIG
jgi:hypothetical protein